jgi:hypothetical protein
LDACTYLNQQVHLLKSLVLPSLVLSRELLLVLEQASTHLEMMQDPS